MNATIKRPRRRKDVLPSTPFSELPLSVVDTEPGADLAAAEPSRALTIPDRARLALKSEQTELDLLALVGQSKSITIITNADGRQQAHAMLMGYVRARGSLDDVDEAAREELKALNKGILTEKARLLDLITAEEARIRKLRDDYDQEQTRIKREKAEAEQCRKAAIEARIEEIRNRASDAIGKPSAEIAALIEQTTAIAIDDTFAEFKSKAESVQKMTLDKLRYFHQSARAAEEKARELAEEQKRIEAERAELARQKAEQEIAAAKERERIAEEQRAAQKAAAAEAARQAEILRRQQAEQEAENARIRAEQEAEAARERERIEEEKRQAQLRREAEDREHQTRLRRQREEEERQAAERRTALHEEERAAAQRREAEEARLAAERADLEAQQEALRVQQEAVVKPSDPVEATATEDVTLVVSEGPSRPTDEEIIDVVAEGFEVSAEVAAGWIAELGICQPMERA